MAETRYVKLEEVGPELSCACASRKCGPHRCRASSIWRATTTILVVWVLGLLSTQTVKRDEAWATWKAEALHAMESQNRSALEKATNLCRQYPEELLTQMQQDLKEFRQFRWITKTSQAEKDRQFLERLERLERRP